MTESHEVEELLLDWEDGQLDDQGLARLRHLLKTDATAREHYARFLAVSGLMATAANSHTMFAPEKSNASNTLAAPDTSTIAGTSTTAGSMATANPRSRARRRLSMNAVLSLASVLAVLLVGRWLFLEFTGSVTREANVETADVSSEETRAHGVAILTHALDVDWAGDSDLQPGDAIPAGRLQMTSGFAQIEFFCGATVIVEGPADLDLKSPLLAQVHTGRLRAQVPPAARGFTLQLDDLTVVDLGTEFGLSVSAAGTDVQVFDGEVELHTGENDRRLLTAGQAVRHDGASYQDVAIDADDYLNIESLASRASDAVSRRYQRWRDWSETLRRDPRLVVYYAFDQDDNWQRRLQSSREPRDRELDGAIVGARPVTGRWPGKSALEFRRPGDRVRVNVPGEWDSLTMSCWVRIDSLDRWFNSLFLTDSYNRGEPHWQILDTGQLYFSVRPKELGTQGPADYKALSPPFWNASLSGRWIHLATVYDMDQATITHYLNGDVLSEHQVPRDRLATTRIGTASIGNWALPTKPEAGFAVRNLNGSIDEFAIFAAALPAAEIRDIYEHGTP